MNDILLFIEKIFSGLSLMIVSEPVMMCFAFLFAGAAFALIYSLLHLGR